MIFTHTREPRPAEPGGFPAISRWLRRSAPIPPEPHAHTSRIPEGCQRAATPAGVTLPTPRFRGYRGAQPPANRSHASGMATAIAIMLTAIGFELAGLEERREKTRALKQAMMQELLTGRKRLV
jgi:hypothetical protein